MTCLQESGANTNTTHAKQMLARMAPPALTICLDSNASVLQDSPENTAKKTLSTVKKIPAHQVLHVSISLASFIASVHSI